MKPYLPLLSLSLYACASAEIKSSALEQDVMSEDAETAETNDDETSEEINEDDSQDGDDSNNTPEEDETDNTPNDNGSNNDQYDGSGTYTVKSSSWYVTDAAMIEDNCDWDSSLRQFFGIGADALLPETFTVNGFSGYFDIQANNYGAANPISCGFDDADFECQTQYVTPLSFDLGTYGWTYTIDFTGVATSEESLEGVAEVYFPTVSDWLVPVFQSMGIDHTQCVQSFTLSLSAN